MKTPLAVIFLAVAAAFAGNVQATALEEIHGLPVSRLEFASLKLEIALAGIKDWPVPIDGASVSFTVNPDRVDIVVAAKTARDEPFREACARTLARVRALLYVNADGNAPMGRSNLGAYFRGPWQGPQREAALRALDANTHIRVDVLKRGSCQAALVKAPVTFEEAAPK